MALSIDILNANQSLATLTDEQKSAIVTLSKNDEDTVIANKTGEIYGGLDNDILSTSGIAKDGTEKTYVYAKRVIGDLKAKAEAAAGLQTQIADKDKEIARLNKVIAEGGGDSETAKQLKQAKADLASVTSDYNALNTKYQEQEQRHANELLGMQVENELNSVKAGLKFKAGLTDNVTKVLTDQAIAAVKAMKPQYIDDGKGGKVLSFMDENGAVKRNAKNQLNPYTVGEMFLQQLEQLDVLDKGRQQEGGGTREHQHSIIKDKDGNVTSVSISGAKTQVEATEAIKQALMAQGVAYGTRAYTQAFDKAWADNDCSKLPMQ